MRNSNNVNDVMNLFVLRNYGLLGTKEDKIIATKYFNAYYTVAYHYSDHPHQDYLVEKEFLKNLTHDEKGSLLAMFIYNVSEILEVHYILGEILLNDNYIFEYWRVINPLKRKTMKITELCRFENAKYADLLSGNWKIPIPLTSEKIVKHFEV